MGFCLIREPTCRSSPPPGVSTRRAAPSVNHVILVQNPHVGVGVGRAAPVGAVWARPRANAADWGFLPPTRCVIRYLLSSLPLGVPGQVLHSSWPRGRQGSMIFCRKGHGFPHTPGLCGAVSCGTLSQALSMSQSVTAGSTWPPRTRATWPLHPGLDLLRRELSPPQNDAL